MAIDPFFELLINESPTQEGRNEEAHVFIDARDGVIKRNIATDLGLWILYGAGDVTVATQIRLASYKAEKEAMACVKE